MGYTGEAKIEGQALGLISVTVKRASEITGVPVSHLCDALDAEQITSYYSGRRRLVDVESLRAFVKRLPQVQVPA